MAAQAIAAINGCITTKPASNRPPSKPVSTVRRNQSGVCSSVIRDSGGEECASLGSLGSVDNSVAVQHAPGVDDHQTRLLEIIGHQLKRFRSRVTQELGTHEEIRS